MTILQTFLSWWHDIKNYEDPTIDEIRAVTTSNFGSQGPERNLQIVFDEIISDIDSLVGDKSGKYQQLFGNAAEDLAETIHLFHSYFSMIAGGSSQPLNKFKALHRRIAQIYWENKNIGGMHLYETKIGGKRLDKLLADGHDKSSAKTQVIIWAGSVYRKALIAVFELLGFPSDKIQNIDSYNELRGVLDAQQSSPVAVIGDFSQSQEQEIRLLLFDTGCNALLLNLGSVNIALPILYCCLSGGGDDQNRNINPDKQLTDNQCRRTK